MGTRCRGHEGLLLAYTLLDILAWVWRLDGKGLGLSCKTVLYQAYKGKGNGVSAIARNG